VATTSARISPSATASPSPAPSAISRVRLCAIFSGMASPPSSNTCKPLTHGFVRTPKKQVVWRQLRGDGLNAPLKHLAQRRRFCFGRRGRQGKQVRSAAVCVKVLGLLELIKLGFCDPLGTGEDLCCDEPSCALQST